MNDLICHESIADLQSTPDKSSKSVLQSTEGFVSNQEKPLRAIPFPNIQEATPSEIREFSNKVTNGYNGRLRPGAKRLLGSRMRPLLIEWLIELTSACKLRRSSFLMSIDYIERFLDITPQFDMRNLQLLAVTSVWVASKLEEVDPPRIQELSFVTDEAFSERDIANFEILLTDRLAFQLLPTTVAEWIRLYLELYAVHLSRQPQAYQAGPAWASIDECSVSPSMRLLNSLRVSEGGENESFFESDWKLPFDRWLYLKANRAADLLLMDTRWVDHSYHEVAVGILANVVGPIILELGAIPVDEIKDMLFLCKAYVDVENSTKLPLIKEYELCCLHLGTIFNRSDVDELKKGEEFAHTALMQVLNRTHHIESSGNLKLASHEAALKLEEERKNRQEKEAKEAQENLKAPKDKKRCVESDEEKETGTSSKKTKTVGDKATTSTRRTIRKRQ